MSCRHVNSHGYDSKGQPSPLNETLSFCLFPSLPLCLLDVYKFFSNEVLHQDSAHTPSLQMFYFNGKHCFGKRIRWI